MGESEPTKKGRWWVSVVIFAVPILVVLGWIAWRGQPVEAPPPPPAMMPAPGPEIEPTKDDLAAAPVTSDALEVVRMVPAGATSPAELCPPGMAYVPGGKTVVVYVGKRWGGQMRVEVDLDEFCIDKYEASQPEATSKYSGPWSNDMKPIPAAQSRQNVLPWASVSWKDAREACRNAGKRLPTLAEWQTAYSGYGGNTWPWGQEGREKTTCNMPKPVALYPTGACCFQQCNPENKCFDVCDMVGGLSEWVDAYWDLGDGKDRDVAIAGGSTSPPNFTTDQEPEPGQPGRWKSYWGQHRFALHHHPNDFIANDDGFRCALSVVRGSK